MSNVLYLTQDGITDHIGQAQIAPYILGLARLGHRIHVVSAEKPGRDSLKVKYRALFEASGVTWTTIPYANRPPLVSSLIVLWRMHRRARAVMRAERPDIIHCRAYLPLELAVRLKRMSGARLLVDFRDFWADVGIETKPFKFAYRALKRREHGYLRAADHIVTLTDRAADILLDWYPDAGGGRRDGFTVIPCCADFHHFDRSRIDRAAVERRRLALQLGDGPVLLYLGSITADYLLPEMMRLFRALLDLHPDAKFLFLSNNGADEVERARVAAGVPAGSIRFETTDRANVPEYLALADLSVVFIRPTLSKAGCSPTKLAELFAMGVPVIANSGVGDLDAIIAFERNGSVLVADFEPATLSDALSRVLARRNQGRGDIRSNSDEFSLEEGIRRYGAVYAKLAGVTPMSQAA